MIVFDTNKISETLPNNEDIIISWEHGPVKQRSFVRRGRPRRGECDISHTVVLVRVYGSQSSEIVRDKSQANKPQRNSGNSCDFVTWIDASGKKDAAAQRAVRSHAMRHRKPHHCIANNKPSLGNLSGEFEFYITTVPYAITTFDPFACLPVQVQPYMLELFRKCKLYIYASFSVLQDLSGSSLY